MPSFTRLFAIATLLLCACDPQSKYNTGLETLRKEYYAANQAASIRPLLALYHTEGCDTYTLTLLKGALTTELGLPIKAISFEPLSGAPEEHIDYIYKGVHYGPSLAPSYRMRVSYDVEDKLTSLFTIGETGEGSWRIVCAKPIDP
ncbi:MAG TPA: hypothetical protein DCX06_01640 [Opitutae bacterium]|nr:hypothetical protein [Opitutae bacterium]